MKIARALEWIFSICIVSVGFGIGQASLPMNRKQAKEEIKVIKSRIQEWGLEDYRIDDEKALEDVILFINDPLDRFDSIMHLNTHQLWHYIGMYDYVLKGRKGIGTFYFFDRLEKSMIPVNATKVKLVTYLVHDRMPDGVDAEFMVDIYTKLFEVNPHLFVNDLKTRSDWKDLIGCLASGDYMAMNRGLAKLGNSRFEKELKAYWAECEKRWARIS
jgi:hypothetical protein